MATLFQRCAAHPPVRRPARRGGRPHRPRSGALSQILFRDVGLTLGTERIYDHLSFAVEPGEFFAILGPSGCGKSTALRVMGDLLQPSSGRVEIAGRAPRDAWTELAFVFQSPRLVPWRTALGNVMFAVELRFGKREAARRLARARELLALVGLADAGGKYPAMLSGGERQRVAMARALVVDPAVILMDEPFSALDPNTRRRLRGELERIWLETGKTIVFVTHDIDEAIALGDRVVLLSGKPTSVLETIDIPAARPRDLAGDPALAAIRAHLQNLFQSLEPEVLS